MTLNGEVTTCHSIGVPLGCPPGVALSWPERTLTALASHRDVGVGVHVECRGCWDEGKKQETMQINSQTRTAYVGRLSNSAVPSESKRGKPGVAVTLPASSLFKLLYYTVYGPAQAPPTRQTAD